MLKSYFYYPLLCLGNHLLHFSVLTFDRFIYLPNYLLQHFRIWWRSVWDCRNTSIQVENYQEHRTIPIKHWPYFRHSDIVEQNCTSFHLRSLSVDEVILNIISRQLNHQSQNNRKSFIFCSASNSSNWAYIVASKIKSKHRYRTRTHTLKTVNVSLIFFDQHNSLTAWQY